ncbi:uncharacterized protein BDW70DRAFT_157460 [Aspergillus foveolatus]|uniref:uncharacterized protein n=1 Tax=Aspergillus foveolatus TaxID=210207 RepID=UPI003CCD1BF5
MSYTPQTMDIDSDSDICKKPGEQDVELAEPAVLLLSGQFILAEGTPSTPLYRIIVDIKCIPNKESTVSFARLEGDASAPELEGTSSKRQRHRHLFYLVHPANAQYRTDIPARYYIASPVLELTVGNIRLEIFETRFQRPSFRALLSAGKTASDTPLFNEETQQLVLFDICPNWSPKAGCNPELGYKWNDSNGGQMAIEGEKDGKYKLSVTREMSREMRDALVATWLLRLWHDTAESKQARRECE